MILNLMTHGQKLIEAKQFDLSTTTLMVSLLITATQNGRHSFSHCKIHKLIYIVLLFSVFEKRNPVQTLHTQPQQVKLPPSTSPTGYPVAPKSLLRPPWPKLTVFFAVHYQRYLQFLISILLIVLPPVIGIS